MAKARLHMKLCFCEVWGEYTPCPHVDIPIARQTTYFSGYYWSGTGLNKGRKQSIPGIIVHMGNSVYKAKAI